MTDLAAPPFALCRSVAVTVRAFGTAPSCARVFAARERAPSKDRSPLTARRFDVRRLPPGQTSEARRIDQACDVVDVDPAASTINDPHGVPGGDHTGEEIP